MPDIEQLSAADLRAELDRVEAKTPALRLVVGLNYKHGLTQTEIATQYGLARKTIYNWLTRLETQPLAEAIVDADRPGRPPKLSPAEQEELYRTLRTSPRAVNRSADAWTPPAVKQLITDQYGVKYSLPHVRRLMREAGLAPADANWVVTEDASGAAE